MVWETCDFYAAGPDGATCDMMGLSIIPTVAECDSAIALLQSKGLFPYVNSETYYDPGTNVFVGGCSMKALSNNMRHFNGNLENTITRFTERPVCKHTCRNFFYNTL